MNELDRAIEYFGSQAALARAIDPDLKPMAVTHWKNRGVPLRRAIQIEVLTESAITAKKLCPDFFKESEV